MREILFRGKHADDGHWMYGAYCPVDYQCDFPCIMPEYGSADDDLPDFEIDWRTVGEYSGYKDSNGARIFEGDVIKFRVGSLKTERRAVIEYKDGAFQARCGRTEVMLLCNVRNYSRGATEIIGNVHDDPELMAEVLG